MNPNPFLLLNHFTLPCSLLIALRLLLLEKLVAVSNFTPGKRGTSTGVLATDFGISLFYNYNTARSLNRRALYIKGPLCQVLKDQRDTKKQGRGTKIPLLA